MSHEIQQTDRVSVERCDDPDEWNSFVERHRGPIFTRWEWGTACEAYGHERVFLGARDGDDLVGVLPLVHVRSVLFGDELVSVPFCSRGSVVAAEAHGAADQVERALLDRASELADERGVDFLSLRGRELDAPAAYEHRQRWVTFEVPTGDGADAVWDALDGNRRNHVRQGQENDLDVRIGDSIEDLEEFYRLYLQSMRGHGSPPHSFGWFRRLWEAFHGDGHLLLFLVEKDGTTVNASIELPHAGRVHGYKGVSDYEYRDLDGGSLIQWKALEWAAENDYDAYDFGRTREGTGVYTYKKSWGGEKVGLDDYHYFPGGEGELPSVDNERYEPLKRMWRRVPLSVTRVVGPRIRRGISL
ncbi:GNAT family N-acetyltransferase [Halobacteriaceae archaeon GCM10025711]